MPRSMQQAVISSLYKEGDRKNITNQRSILLLNYDNKIYTKILVNKIQPTLEDIIDPRQTVAINGRTIIEILRLNRDNANANKIQAAMLVLDQGKAFDTIQSKYGKKTRKR